LQYIKIKCGHCGALPTVKQTVHNKQYGPEKLRTLQISYIVNDSSVSIKTPKEFCTIIMLLLPFP